MAITSPPFENADFFFCLYHSLALTAYIHPRLLIGLLPPSTSFLPLIHDKPIQPWKAVPVPHKTNFPFLPPFHPFNQSPLLHLSPHNHLSFPVSPCKLPSDSRLPHSRAKATKAAFNSLITSRRLSRTPLTSRTLPSVHAVSLAFN